jgi:hypothetical protein
MNKKVLKSTFYPIVVLVIFFWLAIDDLIVTDAIDEFLILTQKTELTTGTITKAEAFEQEIEKENDKRMEIVYATGYEYWFNFTTSEGQLIEEKSGNYGKLPLSKDIDDIPYEVEIEYLLSNPRINRISGIWSNNTTVFSWFKRNLVFKLIILGVCLYFSFMFMKGEIKKHQMESE